MATEVAMQAHDIYFNDVNLRVVHHWVVYHLLSIRSWGSLGPSGGWRRYTLCSMSGEMVHEAAIHRHSQLELRTETQVNECTLELCDLILQCSGLLVSLHHQM